MYGYSAIDFSHVQSDYSDNIYDALMELNVGQVICFNLGIPFLGKAKKIIICQTEEENERKKNRERRCGTF